MGVPSFYRWLVNKYPKIVDRAVEERGENSSIRDTSSPNPNGIEFDCLYLDMNGIIHPCFHPEDSIVPPIWFEDVFKSIYEYIDRLFNIVRPRKLLYFAIDGVAPRAKMNQQRSRRFRTAKDNEVAETEEEKLRLQFEKEGKHVLPNQESEVSDSNIITPGTVFMHELSKALRNYIRERMESDPGWKHIKVILSDANVPGEGEHKIMTFIRQHRNHPDYNPNTRHCLYGLDADLIMLALATHELHFSILREDVLVVQEQQSISESRLSTSLTLGEPSKCRGWRSNNINSTSMIKKPYQLVHVWILREYLELDMKIIDLPEKVPMCIERIIDDFIFMCIFTGNDFLPHMPTLQIHEGAIDLLMTVYKQEFKNLGGYLVDMERVADKKMGFIKLKRVEKYILKVGTYEENIFKKRSELQDRKLKRILFDQADQESDLNPSSLDSGTISQQNPLNGIENSATDHSEILKNTKHLKDKPKDCLRARSDMLKNGGLGTDKVRLGSPGWKERYYKEKFCADRPEDIENARKTIVEKYCEGLVWVLQYYFSGVPSWTWFYPFHYGPFASDLKGLAQVKIKFDKGSPFKPFDQLMGVLPPRSSHALPKPYQRLMTDEHSKIIDFYPSDFEIDTDGKRFIWQGVCKLPFIDESRLLTETIKLEKELGEETIRNATNDNQLFVRSSNKLGSQILELNQKQASETIDISLRCVFYEHPNCTPHLPRLLAGVEYPDKTIFEADIMETRLWHEYHGSRPPITWLNDKHRYKSKDTVVKSTSTDSCEMIHKEPGSGWLGRGKALASTSEPGGHFQHSTGIPIGNSERNFSSGSGTGSSFYKRGVHGGMANLRISESSEGFRSYGRARPMNNSFQPTRNGSFSRNDDTRQYYIAASFTQGRGRGGFHGLAGTVNYSQQSGSHLAPNSSTQSRWRSQNVPRAPGAMWRPRGSSDTGAMWRPRGSSDTAGTEQDSKW